MFAHYNKPAFGPVSGVVVLVALGLILSACGRRGALELPPTAAVVTTDETGDTVAKKPEKPDRPFILDGLL